MRDIPVGNGSLLVNFDDKYQIRDIYFPQTAVFDRHGVLVRKIVEFNDAIQKELDAAVEEAIKSGPPG